MTTYRTESGGDQGQESGNMPEWEVAAFEESYRVYDVPPSEDGFDAELCGIAAAHAPRLFALIGVEKDRTAAEILVWGVEWPGRADTLTRRALRRTFPSAEDARRHVARLGPTRLVYLEAAASHAAAR